MEHNILNIAVEFMTKFGNTFYMYMVTMDMLFIYFLYQCPYCMALLISLYFSTTSKFTSVSPNLYKSL